MMFNEYELDWILKAAEAFEKQQDAIIEEYTTLPKEFTEWGGADAELLLAANNLDFIDGIKNKVKTEQEETKQTSFVSLDPDHQGELLVLCANLHTTWNNYFEGRQVNDLSNLTYQYYLLGNIEGRLKCGRVTMEDLEMLDAWQEEMEEAE